MLKNVKILVYLKNLTPYNRERKCEESYDSMVKEINKNLFKSLSYFLCLSTLSTTWAQSSDSSISSLSSDNKILSKFKNNKIVTDLKKKLDYESKESSFDGSVDFRHNQVLNDVGEVPGNAYYGSLDLRYNSLTDTGVYKSLDIRTRMNDEEILQYSLKEVLYELRYSQSRLAFGRTNLEWSDIDDQWSLGKINNRINFDYFEIEKEGLIGVFYDEKFSNGLELGLFTSGLYVPEMSQGMVIDQDKGTITCRTPWCNAPAASAEIDGKTIPIYYRVNYPDVSDVVTKTSFGAKLGASYFDELLRFNLYYIRKPENEMSVTAEISTPADLSVINVEATPQFYYHDVRGGNIELNLDEHLQLYSSYVSSSPRQYPDGDEPFIEYTGIKPKKKKEEYIGGGAKYLNGDFKSHLGYIARVSEFDTENDILVNYPRWNQAINISLSKGITRKVSLALDVKYDMLTEDRLTVFKTNYRFSKKLYTTFGVNVIGTNPNKESFWSQYENNDAAYTSLKYLF